MTKRVNEIKWRDIIKNWTPLDGAKSDRHSRWKTQIPEGIDCHQFEKIQLRGSLHCPLKQDGIDPVDLR